MLRRMTEISRPQPGEYSAFHARYVALVPEDDLLAAMQAQETVTAAALRPYAATPDQTYAPGQWTVRQLLGHMTDVERVFGSRLLFVARGDPARLPGFEQDDWMRAADFGRYALPDLLAEFGAVRRSHLSLLRHLPPGDWTRRGTVGDHDFTVRALARMLLGHERAHLDVLRERYGPARPG